MASEIRVDKINSLSGVGTVTLSPTGVDISGITTAATLRATTGIVTSLTAVSSAKVGSGVTLSPDGDIFATGVCTATTFSGSGASLTNLPAANITGTLPAISGANLTNLDASDLASGTVPTARLGSGTASSSTFLRGDSTFAAVTSTTINNNAANRVILGSDTANTLNTDSELTYASNYFNVGDAALKSNQLKFAPTGTAYIDHYTTGQDIQFRTSVSSQIDTTGPTIKSTGNIAFASGKGIDFSATGDSSGTMSNELFDDYEEGSWTPALEGTTTTGTVTYAAQIGKYVKIGKVVTWEMYISFNNGNGAGYVHISGLPFTTASNSTYPSVNIGYVHNFTVRSDHILTGLHANNSNYLYFYERPNGGGTNVQLNYDGSGSLIMSGHYQAS